MQDFGATKGFDSYLVNTFDIDKVATLHLNCSGMGVWTAGDYVGLLNKYLSYKYSNNSSMCPGIDLDNTIRVLQKISPNFEQTIIYSYPPFAKDIIDNMPPKLIKKLNLKLVVYGEPYTEKWRQYILQKIDGSQDKPYFVSSVLGSSEGGLIGSETKVCTLVRILSSRNKELCNSLFGDSRVPSLIQFNPMAKFIEIVDGNIVLTNMGGLPLIRYDTRDSGSLLNKEKIISSCERFCNKDFHKELEKMNALMTSMPYLYVFGRSDYSASVYGVLIYPETIKDILSTKPFSNFFSGRFVMSTEEDKDSNQFLNIILETKKKVDIKDVAIAAIERLFADHLQLYSSEYAKLVSAMGQRVYPRIEIKNYGESEYFSSNNKHKYLM
jgi:phenylacetate-CoA ligase